VRSLTLSLVAVAALSLTGCADDGGGSQEPTANDAEIHLSLDVVADEGAEPRTYRLECGPDGGDHPQPAEACDALRTAGKDVLEPVPAGRACTMIYGGPQTAVLRGVWDGEKIEATFARTDGCEIDRWEQLGTTFFDVPLQ
jgi:hypothetical protein